MIIQIIILVIILVLMFKVLMRPTNTKKITDNLYAIRTGINNIYIFDTGKGLIAFDAGMNTYLAKKGFKKLNLDPDKVTSIFLTHSDYDHVGGLKIFKNANIYLSKEEEPMITGKKAKLLFIYNKKLDKYNLLEDREVVKVDSTNIQIISTPGHTIGSACYLVNNKIFVSGDTLRISLKGEIIPFMFFQNMHHNINKKSVEELKSSGILDNAELILTGHTGILNRDITK